MKKIAFLFFISAAVCLSGCRGIDSPPPPEYMTWEKPGASQTDIKKTLLECGFPDVRYFHGLTNNEAALIVLCMKNQKYVQLYIGDFCSAFHEKYKPPACAPGAIIPQPSVERRLSSPYCKSDAGRITPECQP